jgi:hypothetical protein
MIRLKMLSDLYEQLDELRFVTGLRQLSECSSRSGWPQRGVYFFFEAGENRFNSTELRVVRVGTHAVSVGSRTTLWNRLSTHRGSSKGTGNHRGSIFRKRVGEAFLARVPDAPLLETWGIGSNASRMVRDCEEQHERLVSAYIGAMPFLWLAIDDEPSAKSERTYIERNSIALLSNYMKPAINPPSKHWIGNFCPTQSVRDSGLWNTNHVGESVDPQFIAKFSMFVQEMKRQR